MATMRLILMRRGVANVVKNLGLQQGYHAGYAR